MTARRTAGGLPLATRIEAWIRLQVLTGTRSVDARLPPPRAVADRFGVNANTAREAYARLAEQGVIRIRHGKGAFVAERVAPERARDVRLFIEDTLRRGRALGLRAADVASAVWASSIDGGSDRPVWLVDFRHPYEARFRESLRTRFDGPVKVVDPEGLVGRIRAGDGPARGDIVLTRFRFLREVRDQAAGTGAMVLPIQVRSDPTSMMTLAGYASGTRLGCLCVEERFARAMGRTIERQGIDLPRSHGAVDDAESVARVYRDCDVVVTSCIGMSRLEQRLGGRWPKPTVRMTFELDPASLDAVESLVAQQLRDAAPAS